MPTHTKIASTTLVSNSTSVVFNSIPQTFRHLKLICSTKTTRTDENFDGWFITLNSGTTYYRGMHQADGVGVAFYPEAENLVAYPTTNAGSTSEYGSTELYVFDYSTSLTKRYMANSGNQNSGRRFVTKLCGYSNLTVGITSITFTVQSGRSFVTGSSFTLYGIANA